MPSLVISAASAQNNLILTLRQWTNINFDHYIFLAPTPCDEMGALFPVQSLGSTSFAVLPNGNIENSYTAQLAYCVNDTVYGVCQTGFDEADALVACRSFLHYTPEMPYISSMR